MKKGRWFWVTVAMALGSQAFGLGSSAYGALPGGTLDPTTIPKYVTPLVIPTAMPKTGIIKQKGKDIDYYEIAVRQFQQQVLPALLPQTTVWGYGSPNHPGSFHYPAATIEARVNKPVRVKWINDLKDPVTGNFLPHLLPVDQTLHWANPGQAGGAGIDSRPPWLDGTPGPYTGPVPLVTHLHGAHVGQESDGYPEAWWLPNANNLAGFIPNGSRYDQFDLSNTDPGSAVFQYPNDQRATTLWYHDHTLGMTRVNVYAGPAGFYLLRGGSADLPPALLPSGKHEVPLAIQDKSFNADGSLFFPASRDFFDGFAGPFIPGSDIAPIHNPEFFGNTMVVNGNTWPILEIEPRRYRFRLLNACNSRFLILKFDNPALKFWQIGSDGGFLPKPVQQNQLLIALAERADVIVDFSNLPVGTEVTLLNIGPDEPFGGGVPGVDFASADPATTGQVMKFKVVPRKKGLDLSLPPAVLPLPHFKPIGAPNNTRQLSLTEADSLILPGVGPRAAFLGTMDNGNPMPMMWGDPITENPALNSTEVWEIHNFTADAHPIHVHLVQFQVVNRQALVTNPAGEVVVPATPDGPPRPPEAWEHGFKDTVIAYPGEITRIKAKFDLAGRYVWHCHIIDHEDNEMMRPFQVVP